MKSIVLTFIAVNNLKCTFSPSANINYFVIYFIIIIIAIIIQIFAMLHVVMDVQSND